VSGMAVHIQVPVHPATAPDNRDDRATERAAVPVPRDPEPRALYELLRLTFEQHRPAASTGQCAACGSRWPCQTVRLAFRLREGF
jgi:hypothetical protein